ncbi:efflux RND transporter periplasmic adaptor subunit, partial [Bosea eneae]
CRHRACTDLRTPSKTMNHAECPAASGFFNSLLGAPVGGEGQEKEIYVIADLSSVWVELAVSTTDLSQVREGQKVMISAGVEGPNAEARITFISPMLNQETRSARVIATMDNKGLLWRPGSFATAQVVVEEMQVDIRLPRAALQTLKGEQVVFVRTKEGFEKRDVVLGKQDDSAVEVVFGLDPGDEVAVANSFVVKAELGKAEAEHAH